MPIETITRQGLRSRIADELDDLVVESTATGGTSTTIVDTVNLTFEDNQLVDAFVYIYEGAGIGDERLITANSASSTNLTAAAFSGTPDTTTKYEVHSRFRNSRLNRVIESAIRRYRFRMPVPVQKTTILTNNNLLNGLFSDWTSGNADSWTISGNNYQQSVIYLGDAISAGSITYKAVVYSTSTDVKFEVTDGTNTVADSHNGNGWNVLKVTLNAENDASAITVGLTVDAAASVTQTQESNNVIRGDYSSLLTWDTGETAYVDSVFAPRGFAQHRYEIPSSIISMHEVNIERSFDTINSSEQPRNRELPLQRHLWTGRIGGANPTKSIDFVWEPDNDVAVTIHGMGVVDVPSADTDTIQGNIAPYVDWACYELLRKADITEAAHYRRDALEALNMVRVGWPPDSYIFDPN